MDIEWTEEDARSIRTRSGRYPGALDIDVEWTRQTLNDADLVQIAPYPASRMGASTFIGWWSPDAGRVLLVLGYRDLDGDLHGLTPGRPQAETWPSTTSTGVTMTKKLDPETLAELREDARHLEEDADSTDPYPEATVIARPNTPSRMFNLRLSQAQFDALHQLAHAKHLPMSTMARAWLLDRLENELHAS